MNLLLDELLGIIKDQSGLHQSLLLVLKEEKRAIINANLPDLNNVSKDKESLILKINKIEEKRQRIVADLEETLDEETNTLTLSRLIKITGEPYSSRLKTCRNKLVSLINMVRTLNDENKMLLTNSRKFVRSSLALFDNLMASNTVYYQSGKIKNMDHSGKVFSGEI